MLLDETKSIKATTKEVRKFGLFAPIALAARVLGKDLLDERWDKKAGSYWVKRPATAYDPKSAENMF
jgi:hypothetical protein